MMPNYLDPMTKFITDISTADAVLLIGNRTRPQHLVNILSKAFTDQSVAITERHIPEGRDDLVCLIKQGHVVATSSLQRLERAFLLVNSDRYKTRTTAVGISQFPDVLTYLTGIEFSLTGYPKSDKEKLLLIIISRFIEHLALSIGHGRLDATFQKLSRLDDEYGTQTVYETLGDSNVETHVYGIRDEPSAVKDLDIHVHADTTAELSRFWVLTFTPDSERPTADTDVTHAALVAVETAPNVWRSTWTHDATHVKEIQSYLKRQF